ncbi:MAG: chemotaxis protein CheW [Pseudomonadales bacterium]
MKNTEIAKASFLIVHSGAHQFALPLHCVQKILAELPVTPIPFVPNYIDGLVNIDGTIALQVNLTTLCNESRTASRHELILIETGRALCALQVDYTQERSTLDVRALQADSPPIAKHLLLGESDFKGHTVYILDPQQLGSLIQTNNIYDTNTGTLGKISEQNLTEEDTTIACLVIGSDNDQFAFELQSVVEILEVCPYTPIPDAPMSLLGFSLLRQQTIPMIDLVSLINPNTAVSNKHSWLVVVEREGIYYGLLIEHLLGVEKFPFETFQPVVDNNQQISGVFVHQNTTTLLLSPRQIINDAMAEFLVPYVKQGTVSRVKQTEETSSFLKVLLNCKPFFIPLHTVKRIVPFFPMTPIEDDNKNICGAINIEGKVIPVLSIENILKTDKQQKQNEYVIVGNASQDWAICVEAAENIIKIPLSSIHSETGIDTRLLSGIACVEEELIPLLNPSLFSQQHAQS